MLDGFVFREADRWTPELVRALAAKKNMQEGSGTAIDAARILRDRPLLIDGALPVGRPMMRAALALRALSDEAFGMVNAGVVPEEFGVIVGSMAPDPLTHAGLLADLARGSFETERAARLYVAQALEAGFTVEHQIDLFGAAATTRSLMAERVKVLDRALADLSRESRLFQLLTREADTIEGAGGANVLDREGNAARAGQAAVQQDLLQRLALRAGPVSDLLNRAAAAVANGETPKQAAARFMAETRAIIERDGLQGLLAERRLQPDTVVEPGTPEALAHAEGAGATRPAPPDEAPAARPTPAEEPAARDLQRAEGHLRSLQARHDELSQNLDPIGTPDRWNQENDLSKLEQFIRNKRAEIETLRAEAAGAARAGEISSTADEAGKISGEAAPTLFDMVPIGEGTMTRADALAAADARTAHADLIQACR
jgi:hypothetical protein